VRATKRAEQEMEAGSGPWPSLAELAEAMGVPPEQLSSWSRFDDALGSLDAPVNEEGDSRLGDVVRASCLSGRSASGPQRHMVSYGHA
jgi:DNA-directed RNA polymerase sigma subunit (sigma70/sigma32)